MHEGLADVDRRVVGTKQVLRALDEGKVAHAYVAQDADLLLTIYQAAANAVNCTAVSLKKTFNLGYFFFIHSKHSLFITFLFA